MIGPCGTLTVFCPGSVVLQSENPTFLCSLREYSIKFTACGFYDTLIFFNRAIMMNWCHTPSSHRLYRNPTTISTSNIYNYAMGVGGAVVFRWVRRDMENNKKYDSHRQTWCKKKRTKTFFSNTCDCAALKDKLYNARCV